MCVTVAAPFSLQLWPEASSNSICILKATFYRTKLRSGFTQSELKKFSSAGAERKYTKMLASFSYMCTYINNRWHVHVRMYGWHWQLTACNSARFSCNFQILDYLYAHIYLYVKCSLWSFWHEEGRGASAYSLAN